MRAEIAGLQGIQGAGPLDLALSRDPGDLVRRADEFRALKTEGLVRHVGIARHNERYYPAMMQLMNDGIVDFVQVNYSMLEPEAADTILPLAQDKGIAVLINRPFINGEYFGLVSGQALPEWAAEFDCNSWAQFSLKYILAHPAVNCVLTETANPKHVLDNLGPSSTLRQPVVRALDERRTRDVEMHPRGLVDELLEEECRCNRAPVAAADVFEICDGALEGGT